jgi:hypothetical protein
MQSPFDPEVELNVKYHGETVNNIPQGMGKVVYKNNKNE